MLSWFNWLRRHKRSTKIRFVESSDWADIDYERSELLPLRIGAPRSGRSKAPAFTESAGLGDGNCLLPGN